MVVTSPEAKLLGVSAFQEAPLHPRKRCEPRLSGLGSIWSSVTELLPLGYSCGDTRWVFFAAKLWVVRRPATEAAITLKIMLYDV